MGPKGLLATAPFLAYDSSLCNNVVQRKIAHVRVWGAQSMADGTTRGHYFEDLAVGMEARYVRQVLEQDVYAFAELTGDTNPIHLDEIYASATMFKGRIAHGTLTASYISTILGTLLPGPGAIYISQSLNFRGPVRIGDEVVSTARVLELLPARKRAILTCHCSVAGKTVLEGEALMMVPSREA